MKFNVFLTPGAVRDLEEIGDTVSMYDTLEKAKYVLREIRRTIESLSEFPSRGVVPKEMVDLGIEAYREIFFKPYRIVYKVVNDSVYVSLVADGRRDMRRLLHRRLVSK